MQYAIKFTEEQLSFIFNNLETEVINEAKGHTWYQMTKNLCWDEAKQVFKPENPILLNKEQRDVFYLDMVLDSEEILRQLGMDVRYGSLNDTSWSCSKWSLEMLSSIMQAIQNAQEF